MPFTVLTTCSLQLSWSRKTLSCLVAYCRRLSVSAHFKLSDCHRYCSSLMVSPCYRSSYNTPHRLGPTKCTSSSSFHKYTVSALRLMACHDAPMSFCAYDCGKQSSFYRQSLFDVTSVFLLQQHLTNGLKIRNIFFP